jgi:Domain of unknown function (DUF4258)
MLKEPLPANEAKRLIVKAIDSDRVDFKQVHAREEMTNDDLSMRDVLRILRSGVVEPGELLRNTWRYRVRTSWAYVVVTFRTEDNVVVVTAWRIKR